MELQGTERLCVCVCLCVCLRVCVCACARASIHQYLVKSLFVKASTKLTVEGIKSVAVCCTHYLLFTHPAPPINARVGGGEGGGRLIISVSCAQSLFPSKKTTFLRSLFQWCSNVGHRRCTGAGARACVYVCVCAWGRGIRLSLSLSLSLSLK